MTSTATESAALPKQTGSPIPGPGEEVPVCGIERHLKALWDSNEAMTRASLMNFAIVSGSADGMEAGTALIQEVTREHACRALLLVVDPSEREPPLRAWITAHCQLGDGGNKSICSEQISFLVHGSGQSILANTIFAHVDSDLPLTVWWQGNFNGNWEPHFFTEIDRLVIDSSEWVDPLTQFSILRRSWRHTASDFSVNDIAWTRVLSLRMALAACFDDPAALALLPQVDAVEITCAAGHTLPGHLFAAWAAFRAGWKLQEVVVAGVEIHFTNGGRKLRLRFHEVSSVSPVPSVCLRGPGLDVQLTHGDDSPFIHARVATPAGTFERLTPCPCRTPVELVIERLRRGCNTRLYFTLLQMVERIMA